MCYSYTLLCTKTLIYCCTRVWIIFPPAFEVLDLVFTFPGFLLSTWALQNCICQHLVVKCLWHVTLVPRLLFYLSPTCLLYILYFICFVVHLFLSLSLFLALSLTFSPVHILSQLLSVYPHMHWIHSNRFNELLSVVYCFSNKQSDKIRRASPAFHLLSELLLQYLVKKSVKRKQRDGKNTVPLTACLVDCSGAKWTDP